MVICEPSPGKDFGTPEEASMTDNNRTPEEEFDITDSLESLQTNEQRQVLDIVSRLRKCGLDSVLSLPQIVVCGDQSAGKSSVLEALTEIPFPRDDNLCTRFATEIILRRAVSESITIKVIPDETRPKNEKESIRAFAETITNFEQLPAVMAQAKIVMGIDNASKTSLGARAFARDVLSVEIEGPSRPQLTVVDLPGIIQTDTKGATKNDVKLVTRITRDYISQSRTICLAVVPGTHDYANSPILTMVRAVDPEGERTLGVITKPDRLVGDSALEKSFIELAQNKDVFFKLGWHVVKNRKFEEAEFSLLERNAAEASWLQKSNFKTLPPASMGIETLRIRLSQLLFAHVKQELPRLRGDLELALSESTRQLGAMGSSRSTTSQCKAFLTQLSLDFHGVCKAAVDGTYQGHYFNSGTNASFDPTSPATVRRLRAVIQDMNDKFSDGLERSGHKFEIFPTYELDEGDEGNEDYGDDGDDDSDEDDLDDEGDEEDEGNKEGDKATQKPDDVRNGWEADPSSSVPEASPVHMSYDDALSWVGRGLARSRGRELRGNFNPLVVGELFWEQSSNWREFAFYHTESVHHVCGQFLRKLLKEMCSQDVCDRLESTHIHDALKRSHDASTRELGLIMEDLKSYPINHNHYYTDTIKRMRHTREKQVLTACLERMTTRTPGKDGQTPEKKPKKVDVEKVVESYSAQIDPDMVKHSCEEALDCVLAIYKVQLKVFVANIVTQVVERHIVRGLETIFSPVTVSQLSDAEVEAIASENPSSKRQRAFLEDRIAKLSEGYQVLREVIQSAA
ncbi:MAG: hypothetical protein M1838_005657 [Thelocarpon superellum]|nr:MAG: hypothetical protein M1838_005657 [Thelocarpon superellum]